MCMFFYMLADPKAHSVIFSVGIRMLLAASCSVELHFEQGDASTHRDKEIHTVPHSVAYEELTDVLTDVLTRAVDKLRIVLRKN